MKKKSRTKKRTNKKSKQKELQGFLLLLSYLPTFIILAGIICLIPLLLLIFPNCRNEFDDTFWCFFIPGISAVCIGFIFFFLTLRYNKARLTKKEGIFLVVLIWIISILIVAIPFRLFGNNLLKREPSLNYFDFYSKAIFETVSGFSTTGLTMCQTQEPLGYLFNFYRIEIGFFGGIGLVLVLTSAISDQFGLSIYSAEGHGDKLLPNLVKSSRVILGIYSLYILIGFGLLWVFMGNGEGMPETHFDAPFDAFLHSVSAVSTDGITNHSESIQFYENLEPWRYTGIKITTVILMILGSTSFFVHLFLFKGKFKKAFNTIEIKTELIQSVIALTTIYLCVGVGSINNQLSFFNNNIGEAIEKTSYTYVSSLGGIGLNTYNIQELYDSLALNQNTINLNFITGLFPIFTVIMLLGGQTNSAAGGLKQYRVGIIFKNFYWEIREKITRRKTLFPKAIVKHNEYIPIDDSEIRSIYQYLFCYLCIYVIGVTCYCLSGYDLGRSAFEYSSALSNCGLTLGITNSNSNFAIIWIDIFGMLLGRLEIYPFIITFLKLFDRKKTNI